MTNSNKEVKWRNKVKEMYAEKLQKAQDGISGLENLKKQRTTDTKKK